MNHFYKLVAYDERKYCYAYEDTSLLGIQKSHCEVCGKALSSWVFHGPHRLSLEGKPNFPDRLMFCGAGKSLFILSDTALQVFRDNNITGISETTSIEVITEERLPSPQYSLAQISGTIDLDFKKMCLKKKKQCSSCGNFEWNRQRLYPLFLYEETWDGSDICRVNSIPGYIVCTDRVVQTVKTKKLKGFHFKSL